jgi:hypothetical protein
VSRSKKSPDKVAYPSKKDSDRSALVVNQGAIVLTFIDKGKHKPIRTYVPISIEDAMLSDLVGEGNAKVTVSVEIADKEFGRGVTMMASLTLTVNQDDDTVDYAMHRIRETLIEKVQMAIPRLNEVYNELKTR